ncbi:hypothetical protein ACOMHN_016546 [Nucella lapillus]
MAVAACTLFSAMAVAGTVFFTPLDNGYIHITGTITGLTPGKHGFHIHQFGDIRNNCKAGGGHFNPFRRNHGGPGIKDRHVGDLGNIEADVNGVAVVDIVDDVIGLSRRNNIIGRSVIVHAGEDDLGVGGTSTGDAMARLACCVVGISL